MLDMLRVQDRQYLRRTGADGRLSGYLLSCQSWFFRSACDEQKTIRSRAMPTIRVKTLFTGQIYRRGDCAWNSVPAKRSGGLERSRDSRRRLLCASRLGYSTWGDG